MLKTQRINSFLVSLSTHPISTHRLISGTQSPSRPYLLGCSTCTPQWVQYIAPRFRPNSHSTENLMDNNILTTLTREDTIDIMERRQEAAVLRYMRQMAKLNEHWPRDEMWLVDGSLPFEHHENFSELTNSQIAKIMAAEQRVLEWRLQRQMAVLRENRGDFNYDWGCASSWRR